MKPWFSSVRDLHGAEQPDPAVLKARSDAGLAILEASDAFPGTVDLILFDLQTPFTTRFVAMPVRHVHGQDCGRA